MNLTLGPGVFVFIFLIATMIVPFLAFMPADWFEKKSTFVIIALAIILAFVNFLGF